MGLPALYYSGRENPPHPEIWINYFLRMMELYSKKVYELSKTSENDELDAGIQIETVWDLYYIKMCRYT